MSDVEKSAQNEAAEKAKAEAAAKAEAEAKAKSEVKDQHDLEPEKVEQSDILSMEPDDLAKMDSHYRDNPEEIPDETPPETEPPEGGEPPEKKEEPSPEKQPDPQEKIIADQRAEITRLQQEQAQKQKEAEESEFGEFKILSEEEKDELYDDDRDAYREYLDTEKKFTDFQIKRGKQELSDAYKANADATFGFLAAHKKIELNDQTVSDLNKVLESKDSEETKLILELDEHLTKNYKPQKLVKAGQDESGKDQFIPVWSQEQLHMAYNNLHFNDVVNAREEAARLEAMKQVEKAAAGGSPFDRMEQPGAGDITSKKLSDYSQQELLHMDEDQLAHIDKQYNPDG